MTSLKNAMSKLVTKKTGKDFSLAWRDDAADTDNVRLAFRVGNVKAHTYFTTDPSIPAAQSSKTVSLPGDSFRPDR